MAGVQALHERFGSLPFRALFGPAIWIPEHGVVASPLLAGSIYWQQRYITRLPEGRSIFKKYGPYATSADALYYLIQIERFVDAFTYMRLRCGINNFLTQIPRSRRC
jgi:hypothetical protein